jgi:pimeloyl-ACP methyl ester carboxylesterase
MPTKNNPLVIIHGWSDNSTSFKQIAKVLTKQLNYPIHNLNLADFISMDDEITFDDLISAMMRAWRRHKLPEKPGSVDVIVHSTGGLIIRNWLSHYYTPDTAPVKRLLMLAPANFGSPLARCGQAFYSRIIKGFNSKKMFQVGKKILQGLELASHYTWRLAMHDRFSKQNFYGVGKVLCTVLIGNTGYSGIAAAANEAGSDGTVRISSANMNCDLLTADFSNNPLKPELNLEHSTGECAFAIMDDENHSTIAFKDNGPKNSHTLSFILRALQVTDKTFPRWCEELTDYTKKVMACALEKKNLHGFQNSVFVVKDQFEQHVKDYFLEFYTPKDSHDWLTQHFYENVIKKVRTYSEDSSYRNLYLDCTSFYQQMNKKWKSLGVSLIALPEFRHNGNVGYRTFTDEDIGYINIPKENITQIFQENRTLLVKIKLRREQADKVFRFASHTNED